MNFRAIKILVQLLLDIKIETNQFSRLILIFLYQTCAP